MYAGRNWGRQERRSIFPLKNLLLSKQHCRILELFRFYRPDFKLIFLSEIDNINSIKKSFEA